MTSFEVFSNSVVDVTTQEFHQGALGMVVPEWMRRNMARLRAEYQEKILNRSNIGKCLAPPQGGKDMDADGATMAMDEGEGGRAIPPLPEFDPLEMTANNLKRLRKRPGAPKWVRELCKMLPEKVENWTRRDKAGKSWLKHKAKEERQRRKRKAKKKQKKERRRAKKEARKPEGSKKKKRMVGFSDSLSSRLSDSSNSSSSSGTSSSDESDHRVVNKGMNKKAHGMAKNEGGLELRMINGQ